MLSTRSHSASRLVHGGHKRLHILNAREQIISSVDSSTLPRSPLSRRRSGRCSPGSADGSEGGSRPVVYTTPLPVAFEMLLTHWSAAFSPPQHEPASSAEGLTLVCDQSIIALPVGRLRGRRSTQLRLRKHWNDHLHRTSQRVDVLDHGVDVLSPAVGPLFCTRCGSALSTRCGSALFSVASIIHRVVLDLRLLCLSLNNPPFLCLSLLASCLGDRPSRSCSPCLLGLRRCLLVLQLCSFVFVTPCMTFSWHSMSCLANCSPMQVLTPSTPSRAALVACTLPLCTGPLAIAERLSVGRSCFARAASASGDVSRRS